LHEYPITEQIIKIATRHGENYRASLLEKNNSEENTKTCIKEISLVVGETSGILPESIQMYFDIIAKGTMCEGAILSIKRVKAKLKCQDCGNEFERKPYSFECPKCGGPGMPTEIGKEFYIEEIAVVSEGI
jgi:hydrogenase nickel incorporation protein HypA/HybF